MARQISAQKQNFNKTNRPILEALRDTKILEEEEIKYLVMGSLICAASKPGFYRYVDDVDLICDLRDKNRIKRLFEEIGYEAKLEKPRWRLGFYWLDLRDKDKERKHVAIVFGYFDKKGGWRMPLNKGFSFYLPPSAAQPTRYSLRGVNFFGFPRESAHVALTTLPLIYDAPKRKPDLEILKNKVNKQVVDQIYKEKVGLWFRNFYLPNWTILKTLAFLKNLIFGKDHPV